jgi:hypothetical protein
MRDYWHSSFGGSVTTIAAMSDRLRTEIGDMGKSFVHQFTADGITNRFLIPYSPFDGVNLVVQVDAEDVSSDVEVEETTGYLTFDEIPEAGSLVVVAGTHYRYFTNTEVEQFVTTAFDQHNVNHSDGIGRPITLQSLPGVEEYPIVVYASTLALYTLATDAAFDIDIQAPDGVMIPRSERYRQLMQMIEMRQQQYRELCSQLGIGLYKIDVFTLRRISKTTNRYVPVYLPMEVDDRSVPKRGIIPLPTYGSQTTPSKVQSVDLVTMEGDNFDVVLDFPSDVSEWEFKAEIASTSTPLLPLLPFTVSDVDGFPDKIQLSLNSSQTNLLPSRSVWDLQGTRISDGYVQTFLKGTLFVERQVTE